MGDQLFGSVHLDVIAVKRDTLDETRANFADALNLDNLLADCATESGLSFHGLV